RHLQLLPRARRVQRPRSRLRQRGSCELQRSPAGRPHGRRAIASDSIIVAGSLAGAPLYGGHAWVFLNWLLGLRRLGFDVLFVDRADTGADERGLSSLLG